MAPCIPRAWPRFEVAFRYRTARYNVIVENPDGVCRGVRAAMLDGAAVGIDPVEIMLVDDGRTHDLRVTLG